MSYNLDTSTEKLKASIDGPIALITFNKPSKHNAICTEMWRSLSRTIEIFENNHEVRVIILKGAGNRSFVSGADISEFENTRTGPEAVASYDQLSEGATDQVYECNKPTIAMINGYCMGGGLGIAVACDLRIASNKSLFSIPAAKLGLGYRAKSLSRLINLVGPSFAREIMITANKFDGNNALQMGLINRLLPEEELMSYTLDCAKNISINAPLTIFAARQAIKSFVDQNSPKNLSYLDELVNNCFSSNDYNEGRDAFRNKKEPKFQGK
tara:strand:+ start:49541 stop:50347 length:807 start_codon:yes stop_codon:yes gene_type:complete